MAGKACPKLPGFLVWMIDGQAWGTEMGEKKGRPEEQRVYLGEHLRVGFQRKEDE